MKRIKQKRYDKLIGIVIGITLTIAIGVLISVLPISLAHQKETNSIGMMDNGNMMHSMMMDDLNNNEMHCGSMMKDDDMRNHCMRMMGSDTSIEESEEMMKDMDKNGDGICDHCGMSVEACGNMMEGMHNQ